MLPCPGDGNLDVIAAPPHQLEKMQSKRLETIDPAPAKSTLNPQRKELREAEGRDGRADAHGQAQQCPDRGLVDELYGLNRALMGMEGQLMRPTQKAGVKREEFLQRYYGAELDPKWFSAFPASPPRAGRRRQ